jgi:hypothetical protein
MTIQTVIHAQFRRRPFNLLARLNHAVDRLFGFDLDAEEIRALNSSVADKIRQRKDAESSDP